MDTATLPAAALQHSADRVGEPLVGIADHELDPSETALYCFAEAFGYSEPMNSLQKGSLSLSPTL